jgi:hypothetical protein
MKSVTCFEKALTAALLVDMLLDIFELYIILSPPFEAFGLAPLFREEVFILELEDSSNLLEEYCSDSPDCILFSSSVSLIGEYFTFLQNW